MSVNKYLWVAITDGPFIPKNKQDNSIKLSKDWTHDETKKVSYDLKARNILISALSTEVY